MKIYFKRAKFNKILTINSFIFSTDYSLHDVKLAVCFSPKHNNLLEILETSLLAIQTF